MDRSKAIGILLSTVSALLYGLNAVLVKEMTLLGVEVYTIVVCRGALAALLLGCWLKLRGTALLPEERRICRPLFLHSFGGAGLTMLLLNLSYLYLSAGSATTIHYLYPLMVSLGGLIFFHVPLRRSTVVILLVVVAGVALLAGQGGALSTMGILLALGSSVTWAFHMLYLEHSRLREQPPLRLTFWQAVFSCGVGAVAALLLREPVLASLSPQGLLLLLLSTLCSLVFANLLLNLGIRRAGAPLASVFCVFEPVGSLLFGALFLGEFPTGLQWAGIALILGAIFSLLCRDARRPHSGRC